MVNASKPSVESNEKKKGFDWMFAKPVDEVKDHWVSWAEISIDYLDLLSKLIEPFCLYYFCWLMLFGM
jgi:hypothetical protein